MVQTALDHSMASWCVFPVSSEKNPSAYFPAPSSPGHRDWHCTRRNLGQHERRSPPERPAQEMGRDAFRALLAPAWPRRFCALLQGPFYDDPPPIDPELLPRVVWYSHFVPLVLSGTIVRRGIVHPTHWCFRTRRSAQGLGSSGLPTPANQSTLGRADSGWPGSSYVSTSLRIVNSAHILHFRSSCWATAGACFSFDASTAKKGRNARLSSVSGWASLH